MSEQYAERIDLLVTDVVMPQINGLELSRRLVATRPGLRTLFMSGYTEEVLQRANVVLAASECLRKPFKGEDLLGRVRQLLDRTDASS